MENITVVPQKNNTPNRTYTFLKFSELNDSQQEFLDKELDNYLRSLNNSFDNTDVYTMYVPLYIPLDNSYETDPSKPQPVIKLNITFPSEDRVKEYVDRDIYRLIINKVKDTLKTPFVNVSQLICTKALYPLNSATYSSTVIYSDMNSQYYSRHNGFDNKVKSFMFSFLIVNT